MKIISIGAMLMDQIASVERFPGEDEEVYVPRLKMTPGGSAANFIVFCARLGAQTGFIGKVGKDILGDELVRDLKGEGVDIRGVARSQKTTGTVFIALRPDGQRSMFAYSGAANDLRPEDIDLRYLNSFENLYLANLENIDVLEYAAEKFKGTVFLNPGGLIANKGAKAKSLICKADVLICSHTEAKKLAGTDAQEGYLRALYKMGSKLVVVTRGPNSTLAFDGKNTIEAPTFKIPVVDTTGAGDAFSAGFIFNYLRTKDLKASMRFGNAAAALVIQKEGARTGLKSRAQVEALL